LQRGKRVTQRAAKSEEKLEAREARTEDGWGLDDSADLIREGTKLEAPRAAGYCFLLLSVADFRARLVLCIPKPVRPKSNRLQGQLRTSVGFTSVFDVLTCSMQPSNWKLEGYWDKGGRAKMTPFCTGSDS